MESIFKFINRKENIKISVIFALVTFLIIILNYCINNQYIKGVSKLLFAIGLFAIAYIRYIRLKTSIEEIIIEDKRLKFYFFNTRKSSIVINKHELIICINDNNIIFQKKVDGLIIGKAHKHLIEKPDLWIDLCKALK